MLEVSGIRIPLAKLDGTDAQEIRACRRALARRLRVSEKDVVHVERRRRSIDARKRDNVQLTFTLRAELADAMEMCGAATVADITRDMLWS